MKALAPFLWNVFAFFFITLYGQDGQLPHGKAVRDHQHFKERNGLKNRAGFAGHK